MLKGKTAEQLQELLITNHLLQSATYSPLLSDLISAVQNEKDNKDYFALLWLSEIISQLLTEIYDDIEQGFPSEADGSESLVEVLHNCPDKFKTDARFKHLQSDADLMTRYKQLKEDCLPPIPLKGDN